MTDVMVTGEIGLIDAALVRFLRGLRNGASRLSVCVTASTYAPMIHRRQLEMFLAALETTDWIAQEPVAPGDPNRLPDPYRTLRLPECELRDYTLARIGKQVDVRAGPRPAPAGKLCSLDEPAAKYGHEPARRACSVALVAGTFDVIHPGHVCLMKAAKARADRLVAALQSTSSILQQPKNLHGHLPIYGEADRVEVLAALSCVDHIVLFDEPDCRRVLEHLRPNVYVKHIRDAGRAVVQHEAQRARRLGGHTCFVNHQEFGYGSRDIVDYVRGRWSIDARPLP